MSLNHIYLGLPLRLKDLEVWELRYKGLDFSCCSVKEYEHIGA